MTLEVPYGTFEIDDKCIESLIEQDAFKRLKDIHQYGVSALNSIDYDYSRYDHCLGVFLILHTHKLDQKEQISGLLHDASHTAFSHFGDYFFKSHGEDAWQDINHNQFLDKAGLSIVLSSHSIEKNEVYHKNKRFTALDQPLPDLCADRLDYNMQGAFRHGLITQDELRSLFNDLKWNGQKWYFTDVSLAKKLSKASITMMENIWSCPIGHVSNQILCKVVDMAVKKNLLTLDQIWLKPDSFVISVLNSSQDQEILKGLELIKKLPSVITTGTKFQIPYKCRALDPMMMKDGSLKRLSSIDKEYGRLFKQSQTRAKNGFCFDIPTKILEEYKIYFEELLK